MRKVLFLLLVLVYTAGAMAAPVRYMPVVRIQPNGDTLHCFVSGDEFYHRLHDADGFTIVQDSESGQYVYAEPDHQVPTGMRPTQLVPGRDNPALAGLSPNLVPSREVLNQLHGGWDVPEKYRPAQPKTGGRNHGVLNNIVIFIRFSDETVCTTTPMDSIDAMFNDSAANAVSMYRYFQAASYNNLRIVTHYYPNPSGGTVLSYQDSHPRGYFQPYVAYSNPNGYTTENQRRSREFTLLENAVNWINANNPVDSTLDLDMDNDGLVDNICFLVSGTFTGWSDMLWPHKWSLWDRNVYINGKRVYTYNFQLTGSGEHYFSVSTFCHEMTHTLGAPDIYHYNNYTSVSPGGSWDLMNSNMTPPQQTNSFFKYYYLNWFDSIPVIEDSGTYTLSSLGSGPNNAVRIASADPHQWYILEYRNYNDPFDSSIPGRGLLIWRYNDNPIADNAAFNNSDTAHQLWLFRPNSSNDITDGSVSQAGFGVSGRYSFNATSNPHPYLCDGTPDTTFSITDIHVNGPSYQTVSFTFTPHVHYSCGRIADYPYSQGFETGSTGCWTAISQNTSNSDNMGVIDASSGNYPHSGNYLFRFSSYHSADNYNQYLISPRLQHLNSLRLRFYYRRSVDASEHFCVKYSTTSPSPESFTATLASVSVNSGGWQLCDLTLPAEAKYVAINYCSNYQYYLYIDDIELRDTLTNDTLVRDTAYIYIQDTLTHVFHDTVFVLVHDTLTHVYADTIFSYHTDTISFTPVDTIVIYTYDTILYTPQKHEVMVVPNEALRGKASGSGHFLHGTKLQIAAIPNPGYHFSFWMDGNTENPRTITVYDDLLYSAFFSEKDAGTETKSIIYIHDTLIVRDTFWTTRYDTITVFLHDTTWLSRYDTLYLTVRDTFWISNPVHDTVILTVHETYYNDTITYYPLTVLSADTTMGLVAGSGQFPLHTPVQLGAVPLPGYHFVRWSDNSTDNPKTVTVEPGAVFTGYFAVGDPVSVEPPVLPSQIKVFTVDSRIVVQAPANLPIFIYNVQGQRMSTFGTFPYNTVVNRASAPLPTGVYLVQMGTFPTQKVIVK